MEGLKLDNVLFLLKKKLYLVVITFDLGLFMFLQVSMYLLWVAMQELLFYPYFLKYLPALLI